MITRIIRDHAFVLTVTAGLVVALPASAEDKPGDIASAKVDLAPCRPLPQTAKTNFSFDKVPLQTVLDQIARIRCMNFILSEQVKGKGEISIVSRTPVTVAQAYAAFLSVLEANGMALVPAGPYWKVIERKEAAKAPLPMYEVGKDGVLVKMTPKETRVGEFPNTDAQVTLMYEIRYANKDQVQQLIRNLMTKNADLQAPGGNMLILTDSGSNILRILEVLDRIDVQGSSSQLNVLTPDYADVTSIQQRLQDIFGVGDKGGTGAAGVKKAGKKAPPAPPKEDAAPADEPDGGSDDLTNVVIEKIIADERTNQLIVICSQKAFEKVLEVVKILDQPDPSGGGGVRMWVVPLANADAQKAASTLSALASGSSAKKPTEGKAGAKAKEAEKAAALFEGDVKITADETTNSLVVVASARDFRALRSVIEQLDIRRPQVFVEAAILEIAINQNRNVGLSAYGSSPLELPIEGTSGPSILTFANEGGKGLFGTGAKVASGVALLSQLAQTSRADASTAQLGLELVNSLSSSIGLFSFTGPAITLIKDAAGNPVVSFPSVGAVVNLLQGNSNVDILSTPHVMTTDNEKAELSVGDRVPVVRGFSPVGGAGALGFGGLQNVAYEDVKLKFSITPHVNADNEVRVEIEQEVSDIAGQVTIPNGGTQPIISSRTVKSVVVTGDQRTVVIGGLMQDKKSDTESKVPFFGDIPIVGWLFKNWNDTSKKTNLILLLTPYIVRSEEDFRKVYDLKMKERQAFIDAYFTDARRYDPYVDYDRKSGPLAKLLQAMDYEMKRVENGGPGIEGEELIGPAAFGERRVGGNDDDHGGGTADGGNDGGAIEAPPPPETPPPPPPPPAAEPPAPAPPQ